MGYRLLARDDAGAASMVGTTLGLAMVMMLMPVGFGLLNESMEAMDQQRQAAEFYAWCARPENDHELCPGWDRESRLDVPDLPDTPEVELESGQAATGPPFLNHYKKLFI